MIGFIYLTTNLINGKIYIGQHIGSVEDNYLGSGKHFKRAIKIYGENNFKREILRLCETQHELDVWEYVYIKKYHSQDKNIGYNIADGNVNTSVGNPMNNPEVKKKMRSSMKRYWNNHPEAKKELSKRRSGVKSSEETKHKLSESHIGIKKTEEWRKKISESNSGEKHWAYGKTFTEEHRRKLSLGIRGKMSGEKHPMFGKKMPEETRLKMSKSQKERWQNIKKKKQEK